MDESIWVWMQKDVMPESKEKTYKEITASYRLGKALWMVVSTVAHYARFKINLFPRIIGVFYTSVWTADFKKNEDGSITYLNIGLSSPGELFVWKGEGEDYTHRDNGAVDAFPVEVAKEGASL